ncbi:MAG: hypothetical protein RR246_00280 [Clostridia bacterium]
MKNVDCKKTYESVYPCLFVDKEYIIFDKNEAASERCSPFRRGSYIKNYMNEIDFARICKLKEGDSIGITVNIISKMPAIVSADKDGYVIKITVFPMILQNRLKELVNIQEKAIFSTLPYTKISDEKSSEVLKVRINHVFSMQRNICDYINILSGEKRTKIKIGYIDELLTNVCKVIKKILIPTTNSFRCSIDKDDHLSYYSKNDFELIVITCVSAAMLSSKNRRLEISEYSVPNGKYITVSFERGIDEKTIKKIFDLEHSSFCGETGELIFMYAYIKELCDFYEYGFNVTLLNNNSFMQISIFIPDAIEGNGILREENCSKEVSEYNVSIIGAVIFDDVFKIVEEENEMESLF